MAFESFASSLIPTLATANAWTDEEELLRTEVVGLKVPEIEDVDERAHYPLVTVIRELDAPTFPLRAFDANLIGHPETYAGRGSSYIVTRSLMIAKNDFKSLPREYDRGSPVILKRVLPRQNLHQLSPYRQDLAQLRAVISDLRVLLHPPIRKSEFVINLLGISWYKEIDSRVMPVLVMQCARYGSLADFQASPRVLDGPTKARLSLDVAEGLLALHGCRIIHGDVKSENILLDHASNREEYRFLIAKISDFGGALLDVSEDTEFPNGIGGTVPWMAPEASRKLRGFSAVQKTDVYSFGMLLWRLFADDFRGIQFSRQILARLSNQGGVLPVAQQSISALDSGYRSIVYEILTLCVPEDPIYRESSLQPIVEILRGNGQVEFITEPMKPIAYVWAPYASPFQNTNVLGCFNDLHASISDLEQEQCAQHLMRHAEFSSHPTIQELDAAFQSFLCFTFGFGTPRDERKALKYLVKAARGGLVKAQAYVYRCLQSAPPDTAAFVDIPNWNTLIDWLRNATYLGSHVASWDLKELTKEDPETYLDTIEKRKREMSGVGQPFVVDDQTSAAEHIDLSDIDRLRMYIQGRGIPVDELIVNNADETLLHYASTVGATHVVTFLLQELGANPNIRDEDDTTPLLCAYRAGHLSVAELLIAGGASPNLANYCGETPLHWLISFRDDEIEAAANLLFLAGDSSALVDATTTQTTDYTDHDLQWHRIGTALHWAIEANNLIATRKLLDLGADALYQPDGDIITPLGLAARHFSPDMVEILLTSLTANRAWNFGLDNYCDTVILEAIRGENLYVRKLRHGRDLFRTEIPTLAHLVRYLKETYGHSTPWPSSVASPLLWAIRYVKRFGNTDLVHWLLENKVGSLEDVENGRSALYFALENDDHATFELLLQYGANCHIRYTNQQGVTDLTLLHYLAICPQKGIDGQRDNAFFVDKILAAGVDLESKDSGGLTPLAHALINFEQTLVSKLLERGASVHAVDNAGFSVLGVLIKRRAILGAKFLLQESGFNPADLDIVNPESRLTIVQLAECLSLSDEGDGNILDQLLCSVLRHAGTR